MNKKGSSIILVIFGLLVVIAIIVMTNMKAASYAKSDPIIKTSVANDLTLMIDTLVAFPGNVVIEYPRDVSKYSFLVSSKKLVVYNKKQGVEGRSESKYYVPDTFNVGGDVEEKERLCIKKTAKNIFLEECK